MALLPIFAGILELPLLHSISQQTRHLVRLATPGLPLGRRSRPLVCS